MLVRFDPFRVFDELSRGVFDGALGITGNGMPMDLVRIGDRIEVSFDLPGVDPDSVELTIRRNVLALKAERHLQPVEGAEVIIRERPQGSFTRSLYLPDDVDLDRAAARYDHGVLTVSVPVSESAQRRRIEVKPSEPKALTTGEPAKEGVAA